MELWVRPLLWYGEGGGGGGGVVNKRRGAMGSSPALVWGVGWCSE